MVPVSVPRTCEPGAAAFESKVSVHCTGSSAAANNETSARKKTEIRRSMSVRLGRGGNACQLTDSQLRLDPFVDLSFGELGGHADSVLDRVGVGAAVGDDANPFDSEQGSAAVLGIIHPLLELLEGCAREHVTDLAGDGGFE